ncbi:hypothetical protein ACI7L1_11915 [Staphylococcus capitis]|uniref:hypothetical protein n=1 Tax=Staphylococcus capitis TaxID=29388 RepID=UPI00387DCBC9
MKLTKKQEQFLAIMNELGYEYDENKNSDGIEVRTKENSFVVTTEEIKQTYSHINSYLNKTKNDFFKSNKTSYRTVVKNKKYFCETISDSNEEIERVAI